MIKYIKGWWTAPGLTRQHIWSEVGTYWGIPNQQKTACGTNRPPEDLFIDVTIPRCPNCQYVAKAKHHE